MRSPGRGCTPKGAHEFGPTWYPWRVLVDSGVMSSSRSLFLPLLLVAACGGSAPGGLTTTTGITTAQPGSASTDGSSGSTGSTSSTGEPAGSSTSTAGSSTSGSPDLPGFETLGPVQGCGKIDILFVINDGGSAKYWYQKEAGAEDALKIRKGANGFITAMQEQAADYDLQVMVVKGDPLWNGSSGPTDCCVDDKPCDVLGPFPCEPDWNNYTACDSTLGAGVRYPVGFMASNRDCELADGHRYITEAQEDFATTFDCILNVGQTGTEKQLYLAAMVQAVGPKLNAPGGCNAGFLRPDAMLVVVILSAFQDHDTPGTPEGWAASLIAAKGGYTDGIVVVGLLNTVGDFVGDQCGELPTDRTRQFIEGFPTHVLGSYCEPDIGARLAEAIGVIQTACEHFTPPG